MRARGCIPVGEAVITAVEPGIVDPTGIDAVVDALGGGGGGGGEVGAAVAGTALQMNFA